MFHWFFVNAPAQFKHSIIVLQMNCAHLENFLHEAREEAQTHLCAADRRASEYSALRASAIKTHSLFERLRSCVSSAGMVAFADSLRALSQSLAKYVYCIVLFLFVVIFHYADNVFITFLLLCQSCLAILQNMLYIVKSQTFISCLMYSLAGEASAYVVHAF